MFTKPAESHLWTSGNSSRTKELSPLRRRRSSASRVAKPALPNPYRLVPDRLEYEGIVNVHGRT
jgi:hypothetical protein